LKKLLKDVGRAHTVMLDRWLVTVTPITDTKCNEGQVDLSEVPPGEEEKMKTYIANNYFSVGTYFFTSVQHSSSFCHNARDRCQGSIRFSSRTREPTSFVHQQGC